MGRNKKKSNTAAVSSDDEHDETEPQQEVEPVAPEVNVSAPATASSDDALFVEVFKTDKKKPSVMIKGLTARGLKLPAVASVLKRMVGPAEIIKGEDALEVAGDVLKVVVSTLASKFDIPESMIVENAAVAVQKRHQNAALGPKSKVPAVTSSGTAADGGEKEGSDDSEGDDEDDDEDDDVVVARRHGGVQVAYCPACTFPAEMCEYSGMLDECRPWLLEQLDDDAEVDRLANASDKGRKRRVLTEAEKLEALLSGKSGKKVEQEIVLETKVRVGRKMTTMVFGLQLFGVNLADAAVQFKKQFACSVNVATGAGVQDHLDVQGDIMLQLLDVLPAKYKIPTSAIFIKDRDGKKPAF